MQWTRDASNVLVSGATKEPATEVFFSPGEFCRQAIVAQLKAAERDVKICVFTISDDHITAAILDCHRRGVPIAILTDNDKSFDHGSDIRLLANEGLNIKMDISRNHMHHKFMIVDERSVVTGSYNWTSSAARFNHENILVSYERAVVKSFGKEFERLWLEMAAFR
jgi:mitochondrial cardiolipin hydrolase